jgi:hypothetical protein
LMYITQKWYQRKKKNIALILHCCYCFLSAKYSELCSIVFPSMKLCVHLMLIERHFFFIDCLCGLVVRGPGYRSKGSGFDSRGYQIFWEVVGQEWGPLSLVRMTEELLEWKSSGSGSRTPRLTAMRIRCADHATVSIRKSWH